MAYNPCGTDEGHELLLHEILKSIYWDGERVLGRAFFAAKCSVIARYPTDDTRYGPAVLYTLLGDPALRIRRPLTSAVREPAVVERDREAPALAPNPALECAMVSYSPPEPGPVSLRLRSATGALLRELRFDAVPAADRGSMHGRSQFRVDRDHLPSGIYFVEIAMARGSTRSAKLIFR